MEKHASNQGPVAHDIEIDVLVMGSGTGMAAALAAHEKGLSVLIVEKTALVGGSTARSGGMFWIPGSAVLRNAGAVDSRDKGQSYLESIVGDASPHDRYSAFLQYGPAAVAMLQRMTRLHFSWAREYPDYFAERPGGSALGRSCEANPFDLNLLGKERARFRPSSIKMPLPVPITGADYRWINLIKRKPLRALPVALKRLFQGLGGKLIGRHYAGVGQAFAAGLFDATIRAGIPIWTNARVVELCMDDNRVSGAIIEQEGRQHRITARGGVILAAGGYEHNLPMRQQHQSTRLTEDVSLGAEGNTGDAITLAQKLGADLRHMNQSWWYPAVKSTDGGYPYALLAERSLPGCIIVDQHGKRFLNEAMDYMTFGQIVLQREREGKPVGTMWMIQDQKNRDAYLLATAVMPGQDLPKAWYDAGIGFKAGTPEELARKTALPESSFAQTIDMFNADARRGRDTAFHRGETAYDRYYGDPTIGPNPNLRPLEGTLYAIRLVLSDLGTCGGLAADAQARVLRPDGSAIAGLYAIGNTAGNAFGNVYPGAGATIGQGLVFGYIAAQHIAGGGAAA